MCKICAFTGHRDGNENADYDLLERVILNLIKNGAKTFLCGMAVGFDMICADVVIKFKNDYDIKLVACIPCKDQASSFSEGDKIKYNRILGCCDEVNVLSEDYYRGCMQARDRYMVDNCDILIAFLRKKRGGTYYTVKYAQSQSKKIIEI